jgi:NAD(P) transhydrogenase subunit alpha
MDVLSSQSNLAGYRAVIDAAFLFQKGFPLLMTAAGTVPAARVMIMGAGVAGLQAIATAKRLGAIVCAYDVRSVAQEQVESLGASFVSVDFNESGDGQGGYAKEMSDDYKKAQFEKIHEVIKNQDIVITTAQIPGQKAPVLITEDMIKDMKPGSVIVDMSTETGGNCVGSKIDKVVCSRSGVQIAGYSNFPSRIPYNASQLYAKNVWNFLQLLLKNDKDIDWDDEIIAKTLLTRDGQIKHPQFSKI